MFATLLAEAAPAVARVPATIIEIAMSFFIGLGPFW
jgi:hypothetical protein